MRESYLDESARGCLRFADPAMGEAVVTDVVFGATTRIQRAVRRGCAGPICGCITVFRLSCGSRSAADAMPASAGDPYLDAFFIVTGTGFQRGIVGHVMSIMLTLEPLRLPRFLGLPIPAEMAICPPRPPRSSTPQRARPAPTSAGAAVPVPAGIAADAALPPRKQAKLSESLRARSAIWRDAAMPTFSALTA